MGVSGSGAEEAVPPTLAGLDLNKGGMLGHGWDATFCGMLCLPQG